MAQAHCRDSPNCQSARPVTAPPGELMHGFTDATLQLACQAAHL
jgi:hypothetical protein